MHCNMLWGDTPTVHVIGYDDMDDVMSTHDYGYPVAFVPADYTGWDNYPAGSDGDLGGSAAERMIRGMTAA